jgi:hypothetical protein
MMAAAKLRRGDRFCPMSAYDIQAKASFYRVLARQRTERRIAHLADLGVGLESDRAIMVQFEVVG